VNFRAASIRAAELFEEFPVAVLLAAAL